MKILGCLFFVAGFHLAAAQGPQVPHKIHFADMTLTIRDDARREIQKDVDALTQSPRHFNIKVERAKTYFPLIEKVFREEGVPEDFKFLVIQESALIADAVSVSNAVGFWQFKDFTALEMGLRVDKEIDERLNIVSSSRAAARYIKKNNTFFDNWLYALQAYQMGAGGVMRSVKDSQSGTQHMEITSKTYWYVKKYLAHKIAFEGAVKGTGQIQVLAYENQKKKTLTDLAKEVTVDETELISYNKWTKSGTIPDDKAYAVLIPIKGNSPLTLPEPVASAKSAGKDLKPDLKPGAVASRKEEKKKVNGILVIQAGAGENPTRLAARAGIDLSMFLKWNDISISDRVTAGDYYLLGKKRARAEQAYHKVVAGETLWSISQQYGLQLKKLKRFNRVDSNADLKPGMTLYLSSMKPRNSDKDVAPGTVVEVDKGDAFTWTPEVVIAKADSTPSTETFTVPELVIISPVQSVVADSLPNTDTSTPIDSATTDSVEVVVPAKKNEHVVMQGETLYAIAKEYNVSVMDLVSWNKLNLQEGIRPGQILKTVEPVSAEVVITPEKLPAIEHEVRATDTLYGIARKYNVTIKELMEWNDKKDFALTVGEKLKVNPR
jgi:membrane-bound lytic murein transglycosylase D